MRKIEFFNVQVVLYKQCYSDHGVIDLTKVHSLGTDLLLAYGQGERRWLHKSKNDMMLTDIFSVTEVPTASILLRAQTEITLSTFIDTSLT